jgi:hypothetical protein
VPVVISYLPKAIELKAIPILFVDDTSILITNPNNIQFQGDINLMFGQLNEWFITNLLPLNSDKNNFIQFTNKSTCNSDIQITYVDKHICTVIETKFLELVIINNLSWKRHIECIKSKLSSASNAMQSVKPHVSINTLKIIYSSYFHFLILILLMWRVR